MVAEKVWKTTKEGMQLEAFLGVHGFKTGTIDSPEALIRAAAIIFEMQPADTVEGMAQCVASLSRGERKARALRNIPISNAATPALENASHQSPKDDLLHKVVMAVINAGHGEILAAIPELNAHYGFELPTVADVIGKVPGTYQVTGDITLSDKVYRFTCIRNVSHGHH